MCEVSEHPYQSLNTTNSSSFLETYILRTPIRDREPCLYTGSTEPQVIPISNNHAYLDLSIASLQLVLVIALLVALPWVFARKIQRPRWAFVSSTIGVLYFGLVVAITSLHTGSEVVLPVMFVLFVLLVIPGVWIFRDLRKSTFNR